MVCHRSLLPLLPALWIEAPSGALPPVPEGVSLRPWQVEARDWFADRAGGVLAMEQRMGKGIAALSCWFPAKGKLFIVAPLAVKAYWREWVGRFYPGATFFACEGTQYNLDAARKADAIFCHYEIVNVWQGVGMNLPIDLLVIDEPHILASRKADRSQTLSMISGSARRVLGLTGTPVWNKTKQLHNLLRVTCGTGFGNSVAPYAKRYCDRKPGTHGPDDTGLSNVDELKARLGECFFVRSWKSVGQPPQINRTIVRVALGKAADKAEAMLQDLRGDAVATQAGDLARYRRLISRAKADAAIEWARGKWTGRPLVVWSYHKQTCEYIARELSDLGDAVFIHGGVSDANREKVLDHWRQSTESPILSATMSVAQVGIDLSHGGDCREQVFAEIDWTPLVVAQAEMRPFVPGQSLDTIYVVGDHVVDERMLASVTRKVDSTRAMGLEIGELADLAPDDEKKTLDDVMAMLLEA